MPSRRKFLKESAQAAALVLSQRALCSQTKPDSRMEGAKPNIILFLADDMGFSDIGCFGSEISTPHLDGLAAQGMRMSQWYNNPRCCPSRASIMTGLYSHQVGFGMMDDHGRYPYPQYSGDLSADCVTIPEALKKAGYNTAMTGKWHLAATKNVSDPKHNWPCQRGFDRFYGTIIGAGSYFNPNTLTRNNDRIDVPKDPSFYYTDAIADNAATFVKDMAKQDNPFFLYCAFTAPHWPLQATEEMIKKYEDRYAQGWDHLREERHSKQIEMGLLRPEWKLTGRDPRVPPWSDAKDKKWEMRRMAIYAAMIERMDAGVGRVLAELKASGKADNTLIIFMSDNGGNSEELSPVHKPNWQRPNFMPYKTKDGAHEVIVGNRPDLTPGPEETYQSVGIPWGNCANTPFRLYKHYTQEGGISSPFIACWPKFIAAERKVTEQIGHETDLMPTFLAVAGAHYPTSIAAGPTPPLVGESLVPVFEGKQRSRGPIFWEHEGNRAVRDGKWKLVSRYPIEWKLYDMEADRTELHDLSDKEPARLQQMTAMYDAWAKKIGVQPWPMPETPKAEGSGVMPTPLYLKKG